MPKQDIVVVGASAGGVEALRILAASLPDSGSRRVRRAAYREWRIREAQPSARHSLPSGPARRHPSRNGDPIEKGRIYVAPPDCHLLVAGDRISLSRGPKENRTRPAINPLFRSAALAYGGRVTGVILTGMLDDGVAGLAK